MEEGGVVLFWFGLVLFGLVLGFGLVLWLFGAVGGEIVFCACFGACACSVLVLCLFCACSVLVLCLLGVLVCWFVNFLAALLSLSLSRRERGRD